MSTSFSKKTVSKWSKRDFGTTESQKHSMEQKTHRLSGKEKGSGRSGLQRR